jgi:hypothetical protein
MDADAPQDCVNTDADNADELIRLIMSGSRPKLGNGIGRRTEPASERTPVRPTQADIVPFWADPPTTTPLPPAPSRPKTTAWMRALPKPQSRMLGSDYLRE